MFVTSFVNSEWVAAVLDVLCVLLHLILTETHKMVLGSAMIRAPLAFQVMMKNCVVFSGEIIFLIN